ncbi:synaptophysin [Strongylocentrotus purpuratus]|uniref:MARVEL domain-containing protein n=1 Tax=Strongylocentrotus purpuratus TaxID=7668 RepID=A0A7M7G961_STRPU|nr:synaptophysin [Strongylocentrotus purpuratus]|eukprot:XP_001175610.1 PREDICTED: synaptophysin [Strongylocentrotus purpuratus]
MDPDPALDKASAYPNEPAPMSQGAPPASGAGGTAQEYRLRVLMEPRGFLRAIEFILAVCMFATTAGYATSYSFTASCAAGHTYKVDVMYPFRIESNALPALCNSTTAPVVSSNPSGSAQFFVAVGVLAMLYTIGSLLWYVIYEARYPEKEIHYVCDLVFTGVFVLLFFISSCAWAAGLNDVKYWTNFGNLMSNPTVYGQTCTAPVTCESVTSPKYSSLNFSVVFGFLNTIVWGGNMWFIAKETTWFKQRMENKAGGAAAGANPNTV